MELPSEVVNAYTYADKLISYEGEELLLRYYNVSVCNALIYELD